MKKSVITEILRRMAAQPWDAKIKRAMKELVHEVVLEEGIFLGDQEDRVGFAIALLDVCEKRPIIRDRIISRYRVCSRTAQRDIEVALQLRHLRHGMTINVAQVGNTDLTGNGIECKNEIEWHGDGGHSTAAEQLLNVDECNQQHPFSNEEIAGANDGLTGT